jgi:hypothetical protein
VAASGNRSVAPVCRRGCKILHHRRTTCGTRNTAQAKRGGLLQRGGGTIGATRAWLEQEPSLCPVPAALQQLSWRGGSVGCTEGASIGESKLDTTLTAMCLQHKPTWEVCTAYESP